MPENHTIESEIRFELFSIEPHILADMSEIYYERSLYGIVSPCLAIGFGHIQCIELLIIFLQFQFECIFFSNNIRLAAVFVLFGVLMTKNIYSFVLHSF